MRSKSAGLILVAVALAAAPLAAQDRQVRELPDFESVAVGGGIDLYLRIGQDFRVEVDAPADVQDEITTRVRNGRLEIHQAHEGSFFDFLDWGNESADVYVTAPRFAAIDAGGGSDVESVGAISGVSLRVSAAGGSDVRIAVAVEHIEVNASGGADADVSGTTTVLLANASGGSDLDASELVAERAEVNSSGGADVDVHVTGRLVARASGGSDIRYAGSPETVDADSSGGADIKAR